MFVPKLESLRGPWGNEGGYVDVELKDGQFLNENDAMTLWDAVIQLVSEMGLPPAQRKKLQLRAEALLREVKGEEADVVYSTQRQTFRGGWLTREYFRRSKDHCKDCYCSFGQWLHRACDQDCGIFKINPQEDYDLPEVFGLLRHSFHATILTSLRSCKPLCTLKGITTKQFFFRAGPGKEGYKRHVLWLVRTPVEPTYGKALPLWKQGSLHFILSNSSRGFTRLRLDPPPPFIGEAAGLVLEYL